MIGVVVLLFASNFTGGGFRNEHKKSEAKYRVVETYKGEALKYHGEKWRHKYGFECSYWEWDKITAKYDTPEEAQAAIAEWREQGRRDNHHKVVGEIF